MCFGKGKLERHFSQAVVDGEKNRVAGAGDQGALLKVAVNLNIFEYNTGGIDGNEQHLAEIALISWYCANLFSYYVFKVASAVKRMYVAKFKGPDLVGLTPHR